MEIFRTLVPVPPSATKLNYRSKIMFLGSCFSEYIGNKLVEAKFSIDNNPFGIVFNPMSVGIQLDKLMNIVEYKMDNLFYNDGVWCSFDHHSRFSNPDKEACLSLINSRLRETHEYLKSADRLFLTFGTSYVYYTNGTERVVSNCHKVPAQEFVRKKVSIQEIVLAYSRLIPQLLAFNPKIQVIFTVSPIRHWKDGAHENQLSKATLLLAIDEICTMFPNASYFPSYEIVMDDLRDYRFYAEDMLHPNSLAINYIWNRFKECYMEPDTVFLMKEIEKVVQASKHKPFNPKTEAFQSFARQFYDKIQYLKGQFQLSFEEEEHYFKSFLSEQS